VCGRIGDVVLEEVGIESRDVLEIGGGRWVGRDAIVAGCAAEFVDEEAALLGIVERVLGLQAGDVG
jgi:hypothetical protein